MISDRYIIEPSCSVKESIQKMDEKQVDVLFILGSDNILLGIFTPGDMRKYILKNGDFSACITEAMNTKPVVFTSLETALASKQKNEMIVYPIVDFQNHLVDALFEKGVHSGFTSNGLGNVPLVIMAGGKGTRLQPYTQILPKALIPIGEQTILERIINNFRKYGCKNVYVIVNHKANMVKSYFNDLKLDYNIHFIKEDKFMGTAGGLCLLKDCIKSTFILSNCDILINDDLECIYRTHKKQKNCITSVCAAVNYTIPYGVVKTDRTGKIIGITEKPEQSFLVNTGVYVIEPDILTKINENEPTDFPQIIQNNINNKVGVFPISESAWLDMGELDKMEDMRRRLGS